MVEGKCVSSVDSFGRHKWSTKFSAVPKIGDRVESIGGGCKLVVYSITHCEKAVRGIYGTKGLMVRKYEHKPYIKVGLCRNLNGSQQ